MDTFLKRQFEKIANKIFTHKEDKLQYLASRFQPGFTYTVSIAYRLDKIEKHRCAFIRHKMTESILSTELDQDRPLSLDFQFMDLDIPQELWLSYKDYGIKWWVGSI